MERFCGAIGQHVKNRRNPYASLNWRTRDIAQLQLVKLKYRLVDELSPKRLNIDIRGGGVTFKDGPCPCLCYFFIKFAEKHATDLDYILLPPQKRLVIDGSLCKKLAAALVTRYSPDNPQTKISVATASKHIPTSVRQWGQAQVCDGGDWFKCCALLKGQRHTRDCTYVKVSVPLFLIRSTPLIAGYGCEAEVDFYECQINRAPVMIKKKFFTKLHCIFCLNMPTNKDLYLNNHEEVSLALVKTCKTEQENHSY